MTNFGKLGPKAKLAFLYQFILTEFMSLPLYIPIGVKALQMTVMGMFRRLTYQASFKP